MIEAHNITKRYGEKVAVDDLSFTVRARHRHRLPRPERRGQVDDDAPDHRPRRADRADASRSTASAYREHRGAAARGRDACSRRARSTPGAPPTTTCSRSPRPTGSRRAPGRRGDRPRRPAGGGAQARRQLLARHGPAARHRRGAARRPRDADPRRAGQRPRSRGHPLDPQPAARTSPPRAGRSSSRRT